MTNGSQSGQTPDTNGSTGTAFDDVEERVADAATTALTTPAGKAALTGGAGIATLAGNAAAQSVGEVGDAMCGTGIGQLVGIVFIALAMYLLVKAVARGMMAADKMGSTKQQESLEGKEKLVGAGKTGAGAFIPAVAAGIFEVMGISTVSCLTPSSWNIIGTIVLVPF
jgi:hypothetical protein